MLLRFLGIKPPLKLVFLDIETTSLDPETGEIIEIALLWGRNNSYYRKVKPLNINNADPKSLQINGYSADLWYDSIHPELLCEEIKPILSGAVVVAHNAPFDVSFLDELFFTYGIQWSKKRPIDTITLCYEHLSIIGLESVSMASVRRFLGWTTKGSHRALKDAQDVKKLYNLLNRATPIRRFFWWILNKLKQENKIMRYYVRRSFNPDILPKKVPKHVEKTKSVGSPFNIWVREKTKSIKGMTNKRFALICDVPYPSYMGWRYKCDPHLWGQCRLAKGLEKCGVGEYDELLAEIKKLVRS